MKFNTIHIIVIIFVLGIANYSLAQNIDLKGIVVDDKTKTPLKGADVYLVKSDIGTVTDNDGYFIIHIKNIDTSDTLVISFLGYEEKRLSVIDLKEQQIYGLVPKSLGLEEVIITAEKIDILKQDIPHAKSIIHYKEIEKYGGSELSDILKPLPAVRIEGNDLDGRRIQIRGSNADEVNVYLDGILLNHIRFDNAADLSIVPVENIERFEVLKGGNLAFLGNGAFGGVVNITTRKSNEQSFYIKGKLGSFDNRYFIANVNFPITKRLIFNYFGQISGMAPNIEFFPSEQFTAKTRNGEIQTVKHNHNVSMNYFSSKGQWSTSFIGYLFNYTKPQWESDYKNYLSTISYKGDFFGFKDFDFTANHVHSINNTTREPTGTTHYLNSYRSNQFTVRLAKKIIYKNTDIQLLTEYFHDDLISDSKIDYSTNEVPIYHAYLYDNRAATAGVVSFRDYLKKHPNLSWKTYLGIRTDFLPTGDNDISNMIGAQLIYDHKTWQLSPYFNYGKNVKYPALQENAYIQDLIDFTRSDTTAERLKPEFGNSAEIGINLKYLPEISIYREMNISVAIFTRTIYNRLLSRPMDNLIAQIQTGRNTTRGVEGSIKVNELFRDLALTLAFIQLDITNPLLYSYKPKKNSSFHLLYSASFGLYFTSTFFYEGKSLAWFYDKQNNIQSEEIEPFYDMDFSMGFQLPLKRLKADIQLSGHNIFDNSSFKYYYLKKRYLQVALALRY